MKMGPKSHRLVYLLLAFVFFSLAAILGLGFNLLLALSTFIAAQIAFMILWSQVKLRNKLKNET
jgi:energy-converting hydrogenase Eha subunit E